MFVWGACAKGWRKCPGQGLGSQPCRAGGSLSPDKEAQGEHSEQEETQDKAQTAGGSGGQSRRKSWGELMGSFRVTGGTEGPKGWGVDGCPASRQVSGAELREGTPVWGLGTHC